MTGTHPEHVTLRSPVAGLVGYEGDGVVESVVERARTEARARGDAARHHHAGARIGRMLRGFAVARPEGSRQESVIHRAGAVEGHAVGSDQENGTSDVCVILKRRVRSDFTSDSNHGGFLPQTLVSIT